MANSADVLRDIIIDYISQNQMEVGEIVKVLESLKLEYAIEAVLRVKDDQENEIDEDEENADA